MLLWCPDWPVVAAEIVLGVPAAQPVIVLHGNRVVACSETARQEGVRRGLRRREAQSRCPQLIAVEHDSGRDARAFEPVVAAVEDVAVGVEVIRPGALAFAARGPSRYFGGEEAAAERIVEQVAEVCAVESQVGIAEGVFAAGLAARAGRVIPPGETPAFLTSQPIEAIERPELTDLLKRLGIKTLGEFAALPAGDVLTRFGFDGALAHRLAGGFDHRPLAVRKPPPDLEVSETYDEPLERVDVAAFAGRALAERLHDKLAAHGLACTRLGIEAVTANGQELHRVWRHDGTLTAAAIAERVRWQLDGWLTGARRGAPARPTAGLVRLRLIPDGILVHLGLQPGLWGDAGADRDRAHRAFSRVQGLLGPESVVTPVPSGGRNADDQIRLVPWGDQRDPHRPTAPHATPVPGVETVSVLAPHIQPELTFEFPEDPPAVRDEAAGAAAREAAGAAAREAAGAAARGAVDSAARGAAGRVAPAPATFPAPATSPIGVPSTPGEQGAQANVVPIARRRAGLEALPGSDERRKNEDRGSEQKRNSARARGEGRGETRGEGREGERGEGRRETRGEGRGGERGEGRRETRGEERGDERGEGRGGDPSGGSEGAGEGVTVVAVSGQRPRKGRVVKPPVLPPWPGRLPKPAPALVLAQPLPAVVLDQDGEPVGVSARLELTGAPAALIVERSPPVGVTGWAGPWPIDERWWDPAESRRRARFQMVLADGRAFLLSLSAGHWAVEAIYD